jgi:hypothetical protein
VLAVKLIPPHLCMLREDTNLVPVIVGELMAKVTFVYARTINQDLGVVTILQDGGHDASY